MVREDNVRSILAFLALAASALAAPAQDWPARPVTIVVPFPPGSSPDILARIVAEGLNGALKQPFVVENRPGASGNIGTGAVARAAPDGYTIGVSIVGPLALNAFIFPAMPYETRRDLALVSIVAQQPSILVVSNETGATDMAGLKALLSGRPRGLNYGTIGNGSLSHLGLAMIARELGAEPAHVPFGGAPSVMTALMRNDVQMALLAAPIVVPQARDGRVRMLAVSNARRSPLLPELPTLSESGFPAIRSAAWVGLIAPKETPVPILDRLRSETQRLMADPRLREQLASQFMEPVGSSAAEFQAVVDDEVARWGEFIRQNNIRPGG